MENILMRFCRETNRYTVKTVAMKLGICIDDYIGIETGEILLTEEQAKILGRALSCVLQRRNCNGFG